MLDALSDAASSGSAPLHDDTGTGDAVGDRTDNRGEDELGALSDVGSKCSSRSNCIDALSDHDVDVAPSRQERPIHGIDEARGVSRRGDGLHRYNASKRQRVTGDVLRQRLNLSGREWRKFKNLRRNAERQKQRQNGATVKARARGIDSGPEAQAQTQARTYKHRHEHNPSSPSPLLPLLPLKGAQRSAWDCQPVRARGTLQQRSC